MSYAFKFVVPLVLAACVMPAFAQDGVDPSEKPDKIVLEQKIGSVMTSTGDNYETAKPGQLLIRDESMMLSDGAKATVVYYYDNGKRKCTEEYKGPNTFVIDDSCKKAVYMAGNQGLQAGIISGAAVIGAVIINSMGNDTPVSSGIR